ncbi:MAG: lysylphosphatidylglycerol synthase transmembrane domain-containing protein, partial [Planctomycetota bacterium]|nr:lysylphosphatidylglycerol synthase transmembrane domain-containing protein [Planctomycetota bacterium]
GDWRSESWTFIPEDGSAALSGGNPRHQVRPGFMTALAGMRFGWCSLGIAAWGLLLVLSGWRWRRLLIAAEVPCSLGRAMRLTFVGNFFNNVMFGATGGDVVRAVMVTRGLQQNRWRAALSVVVDRLIGLYVLLLIAAAVLTLAWRNGDFERVPSLHKVWLLALVLLSVATLGSGIYLSARGRRWFRVDAMLARMPARGTIQKVDGALTLYRQNTGTVFGALLLSIPLQAAGILSFYSFARALGAELDFFDTAVIFPVVQTVSALPLAPAGWGVGETLYGFFFSRYGAGFTIGVATSVLFRLASQVGWGLVGGALWAIGKERHTITQESA